jgi:ribosomal protein S8
MVVKSYLMILQRNGFITDWKHDDGNRCDTYKRAIKFAKKCGIDTRGVFAKR